MMQFYRTKIEQLRCQWNQRPMTEDVFHGLCRRYKVVVEELPLRVGGFYYSVLGRHFIAVDRDLEPTEKLFVMFHEFAHFLFHSPEAGATANFHGVGRKTRTEAEADIFAICALIPRTMIEQRSPTELIEEDGFSAKMVAHRFSVFESTGL